MNSVEKAFFSFCKKFNRLPSFSEMYAEEAVGRWRWRLNNLYLLEKLPKKLLKKLVGLPFWEFSDDPWYNHYENLEYCLENEMSLSGDLERWLEKQSDLLQAYKLSEEKTNLLNDLPIFWLNVSGRQRKLIQNWFQRFTLFKRFYTKYNNLPSNSDTGKAEFNFDLYDWLNRQRSLLRTKKLNLKQERFLDEVAKDWHVTSVEKSFYSKVAYLKAHYKKHQSYPDGYGWLVENRMRYRQGKLPDWKVKELEKLKEWEWTGREAKFLKTYEVIKAFMVKHKRAPKMGENWQGINISSWVISARSRYREGGSYPNKEKADLLEKLPYFSWDKQTDEWIRNFSLLKTFLKNKNRYPLPKETYKNSNIGSWLGTQRARFKKGLMLEEEKQKIMSLQDWSWSPFDDVWNEKYQNYLKEFNLGLSEDSIKWSGKQRSRYAKNSLEQERVTLLEKLPGWTWSPHDTKWQNRYSELVKFIDDYKEFPSNKSKLGSWIYQQIAECKHNRMSIERIEQLEQISGWTWIPDGSLLKKK